MQFNLKKLSLTIKATLLAALVLPLMFALPDSVASDGNKVSIANSSAKEKYRVNAENELKAPKGALAKIEGDYSSRLITSNESIILKIRALRDAESLPDKYRVLTLESDRKSLNSSADNAFVDSRCATLIFLEGWRALESMTPVLQTELQALLERPLKQASFDSPSGHFKLHFDTTGLAAVPSADDDFSGVPDFIERLGLFADSSWHTQIELLGYLEPPSDGVDGGDERYDIYFENISFFGFTAAEITGPQAWDDAITYIVLNKDFVGLSVNSDPAGNEVGAAKVTIAHEFQHAVQFAYDFDDELWFMESSATWMEEIIFDEVNDNYSYFPRFHDVPHTSLTKNLAPHYYASFIWPLYLSQNFDTALIRQVWEGARFKDAMEALADSLPTLHGVSRDSAFVEFIVWSYLTGDRDDGSHFEEASEYPEFSIFDTIVTLPAMNESTKFRPQGYGSSFVRLATAGATGTLKISFSGGVGKRWYALVIATRGINDHQIFSISLDSLYSGDIFIPQHEQYSEITLAGLNISAYSVSTAFTYSAEVVSSPAVAVASIGDTIAFTLMNNHVGLRLTNHGVAADSFLLFAHDNSGWTTTSAGSAVIALAAGADSMVVISTAPPAGTLPSTLAKLTLGAISITDPTAADSVSISQRIEIFRGDANWDGRLNIVDITYLIAWIFSGGPWPIPDGISGDANCDAAVNIADITYLISIVFQGNSFPFCNVSDTI